MFSDSFYWPVAAGQYLGRPFESHMVDQAHRGLEESIMKMFGKC